ncbi:unnamed protein product [Prunus armeniaca]|uniref:Uncharacterized protein n=1 Tax=Prunus armeniaca TaxID=36596 RepID=A0A6J5W3P1_PRUAR|nr:unnamed protein product [Prunus armeniaca]CAB4294881.1 unnamed protein product [Prunus armeniaca]
MAQCVKKEDDPERPKPHYLPKKQEQNIPGFSLTAKDFAATPFLRETNPTSQTCDFMSVIALALIALFLKY